MWIAQQEAELDKLEREEKAYEKAMASAQHVRAEISRLRTLVSQRTAEVGPLETALEDAQAAYDAAQHAELKARHETAVRESVRLDEALKGAKEAVKNSTCATCKRPFKKAEIAGLETALQDAQTQATAAKQVVEEISATLTGLSRAESAVAKAKAALDSVTTRVTETNRELARVEAGAPAPIAERDVYKRQTQRLYGQVKITPVRHRG